MGNITRALQELSFVKEADVSLLSDTASVTFEVKDQADKTVEAIMDTGYGANLDSLSNVKSVPPSEGLAAEPAIGIE